MMQNVVIQNVIFPEGDELEQFHQLYYDAPICVLLPNHGMMIPKGICVNFASYLNGVPVNKWRKYTGLDNLTLHVRAKGNYILKLTSYSLQPVSAVRKVLAQEQNNSEEPGEISISYPLSGRESFVAFEIHALTDCEFYEAHFETQRESSSVRDVNLVISTTTCRKEEYIRNNVARLRRSILEADDEMREHFYINVVDNGNTLKKEEIESNHVRLLPNPNTGGSGGFARGMMEALHMEREGITNVLLMDDDVIVLPEGIRRTYQLLRLSLPEFQSAMISGAMMELDDMAVMHEDIGCLLNNKDFFHVKPIRNECVLSNVLATNTDYPVMNHEYCGWWYCCIPVSVIRKNGLPLPLFIRGDDVEYGIRCKVPIMTMTGICIWHMGFSNKYSNATNLYQEFRNIFIVKDVTGNIDDVDILTRWKGEIRRTLITYNYKGTQALLAAMEDYLKGPDFIEEDHGVELLQRNKIFNEQYTDFHDDEAGNVLIERVYWDYPLPALKNFLYFHTMNGQYRYHGKMDDTPGIMGYDFAHQPGATAFHSKILAVNPIDHTYCMRTQDKKQFADLYRQYEADLKRYQREHDSLQKAFRADFAKMTSEAFWRTYLHLNEEQGGDKA